MNKYGYVLPQRTQLPWKKDLIRVPFADTLLPIPSNAKDILIYRYGIDFMTPNPKWTYLDRSKSDTIWLDKKGKASFF